MNYRNISQLNDIIVNNISKIPYDIDLVVGIPRSGIIPANLIALYRNTPFVSLTEFIKGEFFSGGSRLRKYDTDSIKKVLIVDDSLYYGQAISICKQKVQNLNYNFQYIYAVIYIVPEKISVVDIYFEILPNPRVFQWNIMHYPDMSEWCLDLDGVLCVDPTEEENDDGLLYKNFILTAKPLFLPTVKINTIVSCRLEKYREPTIVWLKQHNVKYDNLVLLDLPTKDARIKWGKYGKYKAEIYLKSNCSLFIESSLSQAKEISKISKKPVFCIENFDMIMNYIDAKKELKKTFLYKIFKVIKKSIK
jgi:uncharacterized HAD superfamily protein/hypoxanthine phosphoribosyltransferase